MGTKKSTTGGQHSFAQVPSVSIPRSSFDRSCGVKTTFNAGELIPFFTDEALPGDTMNLNSSIFGRLATPIHPFMDNLYLDTHFFAVPLRLLWDNFQKFMGEETDPGDRDSQEYLVPTVTVRAGGYISASMMDHFGIPTVIADLKEPNALHFRAYNLIYNEFFRDENLQDSVTVNLDDGPDAYTDYSILKRGKRHDYFSSCLPWPQKGPSVQLPLGTSAPVQADSSGITPQFKMEDSVTMVDANYEMINGAASAATFSGVNPPTAAESAHWWDPHLEADLSSATAATINEIRQAFQIQRMYERDARGGTRYTEIVKSHFGVHSPDARLQRPEYLGGGSTPITVHTIVQTGPTWDGSTTPMGETAGQGVVATTSGHGFQKSFTEHCVIIGFVSVRADLNYQQGMNRMWTRETRFDYFWPSLAHLGEQTVTNRELYAQGTSDDDLAFGYQERFAEYRYKPSIVTGQMRSNHAQTLDSWHLCQDFGSLPILGDTFIQENPPVDRVTALANQPDLVLDAYFTYRCARPIPMFGVPGNIDRF